MAATVAAPESIVTLPLLPCSLPSAPLMGNQQVVLPEDNNTIKHPCGGETKVIDLNTMAEIPEENDIVLQLQAPTATTVIAPQPIRPVGSSISVKCINDDQCPINAIQVFKKSDDVEQEVESESLPAVISDSGNRVRIANSAYKVMVGQPECPWLDSMVTSSTACKRISGEVMLHFSDSRVPVLSKGFSCWVNIEWRNNGNKNSINVFCDVIRLVCESKDYLFKWRFHTQPPNASQSSSGV